MVTTDAATSLGTVSLRPAPMSAANASRLSTAPHSTDSDAALIAGAVGGSTIAAVLLLIALCFMFLRKKQPGALVPKSDYGVVPAIGTEYGDVTSVRAPVVRNEYDSCASPLV
jgi:hypothetical protein